MAFKKSKQNPQPDLFVTALFSLPERERRYMEDELLWHNEFYCNVLLNIDKKVLCPLFVEVNMGAPTKQLRILIVMHISDQIYRQKASDFLAEDAFKTVSRSDKETIERSQNRRRMKTIPWKKQKKRGNVEGDHLPILLPDKE